MKEAIDPLPSPHLHPCFNRSAAGQSARVHLPVAPRCNVQCHFCNRQFDCVNETRPGVTSRVLSPVQAEACLVKMAQSRPDVAVAGIAGPGDPFANPDETLETLRRVRARFPQLILCVASNGLEIEPHLGELARLRVSHVTLTINAVDPAIAARIYAWARSDRKIYRGEACGQLVMDRQWSALRGLKSCGLTVKINTILIPGLNEHQIEEVARRAAELGADVMNCVPLIPTADTPFSHLKEPPPAVTARARLLSARHLPQMTHCARCRADAAGRLGEDNTRQVSALIEEVVEMEGLIEDGLNAIFNHEPLPPALRRRFTECGQGVSCQGPGTGCG